MNKLKQWFCGLLGHAWTSAALQGKPPTKEQLNKGIVGFYDYATMSCKRCGYASKLNRNAGV